MDEAGRALTLPVLLGVLFIAFKLTHVIDWDWAWVLAPFWIPGAALFAVVLVLAPVAIVKTWREGTK